MGKNKAQVITATELKSNLGKYLDLVSNDNEVIITKNGKKAIRLTPYITDKDEVIQSYWFEKLEVSIKDIFGT